MVNKYRAVASGWVRRVVRVGMINAKDLPLAVAVASITEHGGVASEAVIALCW